MDPFPLMLARYDGAGTRMGISTIARMSIEFRKDSWWLAGNRDMKKIGRRVGSVVAGQDKFRAFMRAIREDMKEILQRLSPGYGRQRQPDSKIGRAHV